MKKITISIILLLFFCSIYAQSKIDSLKLVHKNATTDSMRIEALIKIGNCYSPQDQEFCNYFTTVYQLSIKTKSKTTEYEAAYSLGRYYNFIDQYDTAFSYFKISLDGFTSLNELQYQVAILGEMGNSHCFRSDYNKCLDCYLQIVPLIEEMENAEWLGIAKNNIGNVYSFLDNNSEAMRYYFEAYDIFKEIDSYYGIALSSGNIGSIYYSKNMLDSALYYFEMSIKICEEIDYFEQLAENFVNIAVLYSKQEQHEKAIEYYKKAVKTTEKIGDKKGLSLAYLALGEHFIILKNYSQAKLFVQKTLSISTEIGDLHTQMSAYRCVSEIDSINNDFFAALENYQKYNILKDSIFKKESNDKIVEMQTKFDTEKKEKENQLLKEQHSIQKLANKRQ